MISVKAVVNPAAIRSATRRINDRFKAVGTAYSKHAIGTPGGGRQQTIFWIPKLRFWGGARVSSEGGHSLIFGLDDPVDPKQIMPDAKATLSLNGKKNVGGLIVCDYAGGLLLAHSGFVGGRKIGVGKTAFRKAYGGPKCLVQFEDKDEWYAIVGGIEDPRFLEHCHYFESPIVYC